MTTSTATATLITVPEILLALEMFKSFVIARMQNSSANNSLDAQRKMREESFPSEGEKRFSTQAINPALSMYVDRIIFLKRNFNPENTKMIKEVCEMMIAASDEIGVYKAENEEREVSKLEKIGWTTAMNVFTDVGRRIEVGKIELPSNSEVRLGELRLSELLTMVVSRR